MIKQYYTPMKKTANYQFISTNSNNSYASQLCDVKVSRDILLLSVITAKTNNQKKSKINKFLK